jgi:hypothetical protein
MLEGVGLDRFNFIIPDIQILKHGKVLSEEVISNDCEGVAAINFYAIQTRKIIQNLLREKVNVGRTVKPNNCSC